MTTRRRLIGMTIGANYSESYAYDIAGQLVQRTDADPDGAGGAGSLIHYYSYNALGEVFDENGSRGRRCNLHEEKALRQWRSLRVGSGRVNPRKMHLARWVSLCLAKCIFTNLRAARCCLRKMHFAPLR